MANEGKQNHSLSQFGVTSAEMPAHNTRTFKLKSKIIAKHRLTTIFNVENYEQPLIRPIDWQEK